jgi:UDP-2,4-diacetamido-2,4,6-trideoxy-beta-L-altropyranose hydrolase
MPFAVFRADAAPAIGGGHVMRSLTLAAALAGRGWSCAFACNPAGLHTVPALSESGHEVRELALDEAGDPGALRIRWPDGADLLAVDHYGLNAEYESACRPWAKHILAIDDLANRKHEADLLLDQTPGRTEADYRALVAPACRLLLGSEYALLRPEFARARANAIQRRYGRMALERVLVSLGTTDPNRVTGGVLEIIRNSGLKFGVDVILGSGTPQRDAVETALASMPAQSLLHVNPPANTMAQLMIAADLAIGAVGVSALERCCLGLASLMLVLADNQRGNAEALQRVGAARLVGIHAGAAGGVSLREELINLGRVPALIGEMSRAAFTVCDGLGAGRAAACVDAIRCMHPELVRK